MFTVRRTRVRKFICPATTIYTPEGGKINLLIQEENKCPINCVLFLYIISTIGRNLENFLKPRSLLSVEMTVNTR